MKPTSQQYRLALTLLLAFALRAAAAYLSHRSGGQYTNDSAIYIRMGEWILNDTPAAAFPNGYPLFIALLKAVLPSVWIEPVLLATNVIAGTVIVYLTYQIGRVVSGKHGFALACALAVAVYPHQIHYAGKIMTEMVCAVLLTTGLYLLLRNLPEPGVPEVPATDKGDGEDRYLQDQFFAGLLLHVASAVRPSGTLILPVLVLLAVRFRQPRRGIAVLCCGVLFSLLAFTAADKIGFTRPPATLTNNILISVTSDSRNIQYVEFPPEERQSAWKTYARVAVTRPAQFLSQRALAFWELWGFWSLQRDEKSLSKRPLIAARFVLFVLALTALWRHRRRYAVWVIATPILVLTVIHTASFSVYRFSAPVEPFLIVLAGMTVVDYLQNRSKKRKDVSERQAL